VQFILRTSEVNLGPCIRGYFGRILTVLPAMSVIFNLFFVRVPPDIFSVHLCTPKVVGA
jgi:hypothetical protein